MPHAWCLTVGDCCRKQTVSTPTRGRLRRPASSTQASAQTPPPPPSPSVRKTLTCGFGLVYVSTCSSSTLYSPQSFGASPPLCYTCSCSCSCSCTCGGAHTRDKPGAFLGVVRQVGPGVQAQLRGAAEAPHLHLTLAAGAIKESQHCVGRRKRKWKTYFHTRRRDESSEIVRQEQEGGQGVEEKWSIVATMAFGGGIKEAWKNTHECDAREKGGIVADSL